MNCWLLQSFSDAVTQFAQSKDVNAFTQALASACHLPDPTNLVGGQRGQPPTRRDTS